MSSGVATVAGDDLGLAAGGFDASPVGMVLLDEARRVVRANAALAGLLDRAPADFVGQRYADVLHPELPSAEAGDEGTVPSAIYLERRYVTARGRSVWLRSAELPLSERPPTTLAVFMDVTASREGDAERARGLERALQAERLRTLGHLAASVAHEINNPTAVAIGGVDLARRRLAAASAAARAGDHDDVRAQLAHLEQALHYCEDGAVRVARAASRIASYATLRAGRLDRTDLNDAVRRALALVRNDLRHRAQLDVELGEAPPFVGYADRLVHVATNLLLHAGQSLPAPPEPAIVTVRTWSDADAVYLSVTDTGAGMTRAARERLFAPFHARAHDAGAGLGLAVVDQIVRQHEGTIELTSEVARGSRVVVRLPLRSGLSVPVAPGSGRGRVLVVDDEPHFVELVSALLEGTHTVVPAVGGRRALEILATDVSFDAVLLDVMMPEVDGVAVHGWLTARAPALAARTLFFTGGAFTTWAARYLEGGRYPVLVKPFASEDLLQAVDLLLPREGDERV